MVTDGIDILGIPLGSPEYIRSKCAEISKSGEEFCSKLIELNDPQSELLLLRFCHVPAINHLARSVIPSYLQSGAKVHDTLTKSAFCNILKMSSVCEDKWRQATLKIRHGGFGMTMAEETSCVAFVSCWANTIHELPIRFPNLQQSVDNALKSQPAPAAKSLAHHLQLAYTSLPLSPAWNDNQGMALSLHDLSQKPKKIAASADRRSGQTPGISSHGRCWFSS